MQVYSIGSNGDTNFEEAMLNSTACDVHTFDPTLGPQAMAAVQRVVVGSKDKLHFHPVGAAPACSHHVLSAGCACCACRRLRGG